MIIHRIVFTLITLYWVTFSWGQKYQIGTPYENTSNANTKFSWNLSYEPSNGHVPPLVTYKGKQVYNLETKYAFRGATHLLLHIGLESTPFSEDGSTGVLIVKPNILGDANKKALLDQGMASDVDRISMRIVVPPGISATRISSGAYPNGWNIGFFADKQNQSQGVFIGQIPDKSIETPNYVPNVYNAWNSNTRTLHISTDRRNLMSGGTRNAERQVSFNKDSYAGNNYAFAKRTDKHFSSWLLFTIDPSIRYVNNAEWKFSAEVKSPIIGRVGNKTAVTGYKDANFVISEQTHYFTIDFIRPTIDTNNPTRPYTGTRGVRIIPISTTAQDTDQDGAIIPGGVETTDMEGYRLPPGLTINQQTQQIEGVPTQSGTFRVRLKTIDVNGNTPENDPYREFTIKIYNFVPINSHLKVSPQRQP